MESFHQRKQTQQHSPLHHEWKQGYFGYQHNVTEPHGKSLVKSPACSSRTSRMWNQCDSCCHLRVMFGSHCFHLPKMVCYEWHAFLLIVWHNKSAKCIVFAISQHWYLHLILVPEKIQSNILDHASYNMHDWYRSHNLAENVAAITQSRNLTFVREAMIHYVLIYANFQW